MGIFSRNKDNGDDLRKVPTADEFLNTFQTPCERDGHSMAVSGTDRSGKTTCTCVRGCGHTETR